MRFEDSVFYTPDLHKADPEGAIQKGFKTLSLVCKQCYGGMPVNDTVEYAHARILQESGCAEPALIAASMGEGLGIFCADPDKPGAMMADSFPPRMSELIEKIQACGFGDPRQTLKNILLCDDDAVWQYFAARGIHEIESLVEKGRKSLPDAPTQMVSPSAIAAFVKVGFREAGQKKLAAEGDAGAAAQQVLKNMTVIDRIRTEYADKDTFAQPVAAALPYFGARFLAGMVGLKEIIDAHTPSGEPSPDANRRKRQA